MKRMLKKIRDILKLILPPILYSLIENTVYFLKNSIRYKSNFKKFHKNHNDLIVIGNGPSLNESIKKYGNLLCKYDCMAVNKFANTNIYTSIKPNMYVLADPAFFVEIFTLPSNLREEIGSLMTNMENKTTWNMALFVPSCAGKSEFVNTVKNNKHIHIYFYNENDLFKPISKKFKFWLWNKNLISFLAQTILNTCIQIGIVLRYDKIFLIGADTSWHENLRVEQDTNRLYSIDKHFYGEKKLYLYSDTLCTKNQHLDDELRDIARAISSYWELKDFAEYIGVKIYNASEYSDIDSFDRKIID